MTEHTEATRRVVTRFYELIAAADFETIMAESFHPDIIVEMPGYLPHAGIHRGLDAFVRDVLPKGGAIIDFRSIRVESISADADRGIAVLHIRMIDSPDEVIIAEHWRVRDGKLAHLRVYPHDPGPYLARLARMAREQR